MTPAAIFSALVDALRSDGAMVFLFVLIGITGWRKVWIWGWELARVDKQLTDERIDFMRQLNEMREERDSWRRSSLMLQAQRGPGPPPNPLEGD